MDLITLSIPVFFVLIGVELVAGLARGRRIFRGPDVTADLATGTLQTIFGVVAAGLLSAMYLTVYEHRLVTLPENQTWVYVFAFVATDFCYYWFHRASHRVMLFWATHAPHHSSEDYNLAVALRQGPIQPLGSRLFYLPLALVGVSYPVFVLMVSINTLYQFWIHSELIPKLGPIEWIFNTPSHHRVHHGCNGRYLDKNHGGIFIVFDRLFGTFVEEDDAERPIYGTVKALTTWNPLLATWQPFKEIGHKLAASHGVVDVARSIFGPPEWLPAGMVGSPDVTGPRAKFSTTISPAVGRYVAVQFVVVLLASVAYLLHAGDVSTTASWAAALWLTVSYGSLGALLDGSPVGRAVEVARFVVGVPLLFALTL